MNGRRGRRFGKAEPQSSFDWKEELPVIKSAFSVVWKFSEPIPFLRPTGNQ
jgi:hypothetical protein